MLYLPKHLRVDTGGGMPFFGIIEFLHIAFFRLITAIKAVLHDKILIDPLGAELCRQLVLDVIRPRFAPKWESSRQANEKRNIMQLFWYQHQND